MALFTISAHDIDAGGFALSGELPVAWLNEELADAGVTAPGPGRVEGRLSRSGNDVVVRGRVRAALVIPCARCLAETAVPIDTELSLLLRPAARAEEASLAERHAGRAHAHKRANGEAHKEKDKDKDVEYEFGADEADQDVYDGDTVILDSFLREAILLEVPNFPLCSEACPGIRPAAAAPADADSALDPPVDPRLAPLGALRAKLAEKLPSPPPNKKKIKE